MSQDNGGNVVLGLAVAVLGYVMYTHFTQAARASVPTTTGVRTTTPSAAAAWANAAQAIVAPFTTSLNAGGVKAGMTNGNYSFDQVYSSTSYNPDAISQAMQQDTYDALGAQGMDTSNVYGFYE